ncbi:FAD-binding oxidoreductase [Candidatus Poribacteria bacterium]|nr:FAD-binding oxidoreductase [Candidatus Poribacteria bacterium]MYH82250.1 FAD-binding oxidoreductase [Candidatus Poribacteria bacterium]MYK95026.1 FAD-binding oxidoreductase [Candidatus Poribacteria bacterium]
MENSRALHDELKHIVGKSGILPEVQIAAYTFDGHIPKAVVLPASVQEMQEVLQFASKRDLSVMPAGAGTKLGIGNLPQKVDIVLATTRLNSVVEYEPADLTVTVEAGIRLAALQAVLAQHRQYLALDPPYTDRCTLGGIVATNASGSLRLRHGAARNQVLGLQVVHANGTVVKSGGKVVKNVAGYDLNKLYIGAFGTLGIITEVTLKLSPIPAHEAILVADFQNVQGAIDTGLSIIGSQILPMFVNLSINSDFVGTATDNATDAKRPTLVVGFGGDPETVAWQLTECRGIMEQNGALGVTSTEGESRAHLQKAIREFPATDTDTERVIAKLNLKRTGIAEFAARVMDASWARDVQVMALLGSGILYLSMPVTSDTDFEGLANTLTQLRQSATEARGNLIVEAAPPELKQHIDVWGAVGDTLGLMKQVKNRFDAGSLLNPGRFVSGI